MKKWSQRRRKTKSSKSKRAKRLKSRSRSLKSLNKKGGAPPSSSSYVGSIQGEFINHKGQQLFRNPVGGIA
jgi:hypothetical protein